MNTAPFNVSSSPTPRPRLASASASLGPVHSPPAAGPTPRGTAPIRLTLRRRGVVVVALTMATGSARTTPGSDLTARTRLSGKALGAVNGPNVPAETYHRSAVTDV